MSEYSPPMPAYAMPQSLEMHAANRQKTGFRAKAGHKFKGKFCLLPTQEKGKWGLARALGTPDRTGNCTGFGAPSSRQNDCYRPRGGIGGIAKKMVGA